MSKDINSLPHTAQDTILHMISKCNISQAGSFHASPVDSTISLAESELSQAGSTQSSLEDSALQAESAVLLSSQAHSPDR